MTFVTFRSTVHTVFIAIIYKTRTIMGWYITASLRMTFKSWTIASLHILKRARFTNDAIPI